MSVPFGDWKSDVIGWSALGNAVDYQHNAVIPKEPYAER
jgi:hypothetical protein